MNPEIAKWVGPGIIYLFITGILWRCVFGNLLDDIHEKLTNSRMDFFLLPGKFRDRDFYIRFYKVVSILSSLLVSVFFLLLAITELAE